MANDDAQQPCEYLPWDSGFFGCRIARALVPLASELSASAIDQWCAEHRIDCLYVLSEGDDTEVNRIAEGRGFERVDVRVVMEAAVEDLCETSGAGGSVRPWVESDMEALKRIAAASHRGTRFYTDRHFSRSHCDALYSAWIDNSCHGWADSVLVGELDGQVGGYVSTHLHRDGVGRLGLVAVDKFARRRGLGRQLIARALERCAARGARRVTVATQGNNLEAQRLYSRAGFRVQSIHVWHHKWFRKPVDKRADSESAPATFAVSFDP